MEAFAVIDTETNWSDQVMSIGTIIADAETFRLLDAKYHVITPEYLVGGMFSDTLFIDRNTQPLICSRNKAVTDLMDWFASYGIRRVFAYNACFDRNHLPELRFFEWYDIMRLAAYKQYNHKIPSDAPCCATGRLKRGYGVEAMLRLLSGVSSYQETHNALYDAADELEIMRLLGYPLDTYTKLKD